MESRSNLAEATVEELQELVKANANSARIYGEAAELAGSSHLETLFRDLRDERRAQATELRAHLATSGVAQDAETTLTAPLQTWFMKARDAIQKDHHVGVLSELERSEDRILHAYEDALRATAGSPVNGDLQRQVGRVKAAHDRIRDLRDAAKARD